MIVTLPPELERRLSVEAAKQGLDVEQFAVKVLGESLPADRKSDAVALLQSWIDADDTEASDQKATGDFLSQALDADRLSDRKLFPPELKGVTW
ncbi:MAG: hypothetical protein FD138_897 [Planctomycetota bacterium]|nr:MAG: hypothetical protein FD138_897 [Planctomycetota bacterium]